MQARVENVEQTYIHNLFLAGFRESPPGNRLVISIATGAAGKVLFQPFGYAEIEIATYVQQGND